MINCIVAVERNQGIGFNGSMPWPRLSGDMRWFKEKTTDQIVIMGRKTWESIGSKNLPNRINIVISRNLIDGADQCFSDTDRALDFCNIFYPYKEIFIIGGNAIYQHYLDIIDRFYITEIDADYKCDTFFDLNYVRENFTKVKEYVTFNEPIKYTIKEYNI
jgi:dihydrofolate reductase